MHPLPRSVVSQHAPAPRVALEALLGVPFTEGNAIEVLRNGQETFPSLLAAVSGATRTIDLLWFAWRGGVIGRELAEALAGRAGDGVRVRVLLDAYGGRHVDRRSLERLRRAGCQVLFYRPMPSWRPTVWNLRTHRRVLVCDESLAFTGGTGIADSWTGDGRSPGHWRDTAFRVRGPAVAGLRAVFAGPWLQAQARDGGCGPFSDVDRFPALESAGPSAVQVLRPSSGPGWNDAAMAVAVLLCTARRRVRVATPYVRLPRWLRGLVCATAERGVAVELLVSGPHVDRPSVHLQGENEYQHLLEAGVRIWRYQPTLQHAKVITVDGELAMGGTANLDTRSLGLNEQVCLLMQDRAVAATLDAHFDEDLDVSSPVEPAQWRSRSLHRKLLDYTSDLVGRPLRGWGGTGLVGWRPSGRALSHRDVTGP